MRTFQLRVLRFAGLSVVRTGAAWVVIPGASALFRRHEASANAAAVLLLASTVITATTSPLAYLLVMTMGVPANDGRQSKRSLLRALLCVLHAVIGGLSARQ